MAPMETFCFVFLIRRNPPMEIREIIGIYVAQGVLTNARVGFLVEPPQFLIRDKSLSYRQNFPQDSRNMENVKQQSSSLTN